MAARPEPRVNLLPVDRFEYSRVGRFLRWALLVGRRAVMLTELVVIAAFLSRFWFDRSLVNLRELRIQKEAVVDSYETVLTEFLRTQSRLAAIRNILNERYHVTDRLTKLQSMTPEGIEYGEVIMSSQSANLRGYAPSASVLSTFLANLKQEPETSKVAVRLLEISKKRLPGFDFEVTLTISQQQERKEKTAQ